MHLAASAAALLLSLVLCLLREGRSVEVRGLRPDVKGSYVAERDFTCLDGSATVPFSLVNDDYCDCGDGSDEPGTAACPNGRFHCTNKGHRAANILSSRVNDGVCDCCDGSDEYDSRVDCPNTCDELGRRVREEEERQRQLQLSGHVKRLDYAKQGQQKQEEQIARLSELEQEVAELGDEMEQLRIAKEAAEEPEKAAKDEHQRLWEEEKAARKEAQRVAEAQAGFDELDTNSDGLVGVAELMARPELDDDGDGDVSEVEALEYLDQAPSVGFEVFLENVWGVVSDKCRFGIPKEQQRQQEETLSPVEEGGQATDMEDAEGTDPDYDDEEEEEDDDDLQVDRGEDMPAFDAATQELISAADDAREKHRNAESRKRSLDHELDNVKKYLGVDLGPAHEFSPLYDQCFEYTDREYTYKLCPFSKVIQRGKSGGRETPLGNWGSWDGSAGRLHSRMKYDNGEKCWNGPSRSALISLKCGLTEELLSASEPNRCEYAMDFATPAACDPTQHGFQHTEL